MEPRLSSYSLGIDIGTTKVALALICVESKEVVATAALSHHSDVQGLGAGRSEQVVSTIFSCLDACIDLLPERYRRAVSSIGVTGQMHGVVLWNKQRNELSNLITWQDQRCLEDGFISRLRESTGDATAQSGYGNSTLAWLVAYEPEMIVRFSAAAAIHDYLVAEISDSSKHYTDPSNAASFGFFDLITGQWHEESLTRARVPRAFLPEVRPAGEKVGALSSRFASRWCLPEGVPIANALGDNQASLYSSLTDPARQIALTIGTGSQLSVVVSAVPNLSIAGQGKFEFRPYVGSSYIAVAASLSGGRVLHGLARALAHFMEGVGVEPLPSLETIYQVMHAQGLARISTNLRAEATFSGERYDPALRGSVTNLSFDNCNVGDITAALCRGLVQSLKEALPQDLLVGRSEVVGSGNAICRSPLMQKIIKECFGCGLTLRESAESTACGAALLAAPTK